MRAERRTNLLLAFVLLALAAAMFARALGLVPANIADVGARALPALLVLGGLALLLRGRLPASGLIALILTGAVVAGVAFTAFNQRAAQVRTETQQALSQPLGEEAISLLRLRIETGATDVELMRALGDAPSDANTIGGLFTGSAENTAEATFERAADGSATYTLVERRTSEFPSLEAVGRGTLRVELPPNVPLDVDLTAADGDVLLNMSGLSLERMNMTVAQGDLVATWPSYAPASSAAETTNGTLTAQAGSVTLFIPPLVAARLELDRGGSSLEPQFDPAQYNYLRSDVLESRAIESASTIIRYRIVSPRGQIRVEVPPA